jgi:hypothetical protein
MGMGQWDLNRGKDIGVKINYALRKTLCRDAINRVFRSFPRLCLKGKGIKVFPMPHPQYPDYRYCAKVLVRVVFGTAPTTVSTCRPPLKTNSVGMLRIP